MKSSKYCHSILMSKSPVLMGSMIRSILCVPLGRMMPCRGSILMSHCSKWGCWMRKAHSWWLRLTSCSSRLRNLLEL